MLSFSCSNRELAGQIVSLKRGGAGGCNDTEPYQKMMYTPSLSNRAVPFQKDVTDYVDETVIEVPNETMNEVLGPHNCNIQTLIHIGAISSFLGFIKTYSVILDYT